MKDFVGQCDVCLTHRDSQVQEPLLQHKVPPRPWAKIAADICFHSGRALLVVVDYFSNFTKCRAAGVSEFQALLDWRNTPSEGMDTSCKTLLPTSGSLLTPEFSLINDAAKLCARKERQRRYFNRGKRVLSPVRTGETIRICSPSGTWRPAECLREVAPRSYKVLVDGAVRHRNRKDIWRTAEPQNAQACEEVEPFAEVQRAPVASPGPVPETPLVSPASTPIEADCVGESASPSPVMSPSSVPESTAQPLRRSTRQRRPPARFKDFIVS